MKITALFAALLLAHPVQAATVSGRLTVLKKDGKQPHDSFADAVVYIEGPITPPPAVAAVITQQGKKFMPRILPVVRGQAVSFYNADSVSHNVFSPDKVEPFDLGRFPRGESKEQRFDALGRHILYCNIHQKMIADLLVLPNHYFAPTDKEGRFSIPDVPPGRHTLKVWHIFGGEAQQQIDIGSEPLTVELQVVSTKMVGEIEKHKNKTGRSYPREDDGY